MAPPWTLVLLLMSVGTLAAPTQCPTACTCKAKRGALFVDCSFRSLSAIPHRFPSTPNVLDMSGNKISKLHAKTFSGKGLMRAKVLVLREMQIAVIDPSALKGLKGLRKLDLSFNNLHNVEPDMFPPGLRSLDVRGNNHLDCQTLKRKFAVRGKKFRFFCSHQKRRSLRENLS